MQRWVWDGTRGATRAGDVALPSSRRRPGLCVEGLASEARTSSYARFGCRHVPLVATNLFPFSLVPSILCLLPSPLQTWAYSIVLWFAGVIPRSKSSHFQLALDNWSRCLFWDLCSSSTLAGLCSVPSAEVAVDDLSSVNSPPLAIFLLSNSCSSSPPSLRPSKTFQRFSLLLGFLPLKDVGVC